MPYEKDGAYSFLKAAKAGNIVMVKDLLAHCKYLVYDFDEVFVLLSSFR